MKGCEFVDNGPVHHVVTVGPGAQLKAWQTCFVDNAAIWEARVEGRVFLECCAFVPHMWQVVDDGQVTVAPSPSSNRRSK